MNLIPGDLGIRDQTDWNEYLGQRDTPAFNYFQRFELTAHDPFAGAIVGYTRAKHPILTRLLWWPLQLSMEASAFALWLGGVERVDDEYVARNTGFEWIVKRIIDLQDDWGFRQPIYDEGKVAANRRRIAEELATRPTMTGGSDPWISRR
jgi:hypothetical protein